MLRNYLLTTLRNIKKTKLFSFINILGLTIGMTACLLILYYVTYERSYDRFYENSDRIYRLRYERTDKEGMAVRFASCCPPAAPWIRKLYPEVEKVARIFCYKASVSHGEKRFIEERMYFAESDFFGIFKLRFIEGDPLNGISEPNRAFISQTTAKKYFGDENPIGKTFSVDKKTDYHIVGIFEDIPQNSHLKFDILLSYPNLLSIYGKEIEQDWGETGFFTYLLFKPNADPIAFEKKLPALVEAEFGEALRYYKLTCQLPLQPLTDIHLSSHFMQEYEANGDRDTVNFLSAIAIFIILIAWVNYVNLSTSRALTRAKEVGLRKTVGASRFQLMKQFFLEIIILNVVSILLTLGLILVLLPSFSNITGISADYTIWTQDWFWIALVIMFLAGVFLSGLYPVMVLSSFKPAAVLRGKLGNSARGMNLRKALVVFQFIMAICLITCTVAVFKQLSFMKNQDLGFSIDQKLIIRAPRVRDALFGSKVKTFKEQLLKNSSVNNFCVVTEVPGRQVLSDAGGIHRVGSDVNRNYQILGIDYDFADVFDIKFVSGRNFSKDFPSDTSALILNETAAKWMGFPSSDSALHQQVDFWGKIYTIIGIIKDYHQQSLKAEFEPHLFELLPTGRGVRGMFALNVSTQNITSTIQEIQKQYDEFFPGNPFEYFFLDEYYNEQYKADELFGNVFGIFSFLAIFVTSLGILGLSSFIIVQRTKEIGIRKVLGAGAFRILLIITKDFLLLIMVSFFIALPLSYVGIRYWLDSFAVRMDLTVSLFVIPLVLVASITAVTICSHVIKAVRANPIDSLRYE